MRSGRKRLGKATTEKIENDIGIANKADHGQVHSSRNATLVDDRIFRQVDHALMALKLRAPIGTACHS